MELKDICTDIDTCGCKPSCSCVGKIHKMHKIVKEKL